MGSLSLIIATPKGSLQPIKCDSVHLTVSGDAKGRKGGSYGIRQGHVNAVFSLERGTITALLNGDTVFSANTSKGFAAVNQDTVTAVIENYEKNI